MDLLSGIDSRTSALKLKAPGPTRAHLEQILQAGTRAPDHGRLRPWRFVVLEGDARLKLADAMADLLRAKQPQATPEQLEGERRKPMRAPTIIVVAARCTKAKIPEIEQIGAVSAAVQNMFLAAHALGYGAMWKTGAAAYDATVKKAIGLEATDHVVAYLYLGAIDTPGPRVATSLDACVKWMS